MIISVVQMSFSKGSFKSHVQNAYDLCDEYNVYDSDIVFFPELFGINYFCQNQEKDFFLLADVVSEHYSVRAFRAFCRKFQCFCPISFFERNQNCYYNSVAWINPDGIVCDVYRKSHIPDGPGYQEKFYFCPGNTGFRVWKTPVGCVGIGICWDQWFPEHARCITQMGADVILYPSAIGSEPDSSFNTCTVWQNAMIGHSIHNVIPIAAANRFGTEKSIDFYGSSFICDALGFNVEALSHSSCGCITRTIDVKGNRLKRAEWGFFRDRRPDLYSVLCQKK